MGFAVWCVCGLFLPVILLKSTVVAWNWRAFGFGQPSHSAREFTPVCSQRNTIGGFAVITYSIRLNAVFHHWCGDAIRSAESKYFSFFLQSGTIIA